MQMEELCSAVGQRDVEIESLRTKLSTLDEHSEDHSRHVSVLRQQMTARDEQAAMLQTDVCIIHTAHPTMSLLEL